MQQTIKQTTAVRTLALLAVLTTLVAGHATSAQAFVVAQAPTLTNDVGQPGGGAEQQLVLGIVLLVVGVLGVVAGAAARRKASRAN